MIRRLIILLLIVGCEEVLEPEDCAGVVGGDAVVDHCGICDGKLSCIYGDWKQSVISYYSINKNRFDLVNASSCSRIYSYYNIIEFSDSCLNTNLAIETALYSYSFKLSDFDENILYTNIVKVNSQNLQSSIDLENCKMVDTLTRVNEIVNPIDSTSCSI